MYTDYGKLTYANRYSIREGSHNSRDEQYMHNVRIMFQMFVQQVNSGVTFNNKLEYLYDNGSMSDLGYDQRTNYMYLKK
jgi:hypothetical protein